ncbi:hypothetical protein VTO42DRAFT_7477 [Malbranchea cinnamomea]
MSCLPRSLGRLLGSSLPHATPRSLFVPARSLSGSFKTPHRRQLLQPHPNTPRPVRFSSSSSSSAFNFFLRSSRRRSFASHRRHASFSFWTLALSALVLCGGFVLQNTFNPTPVDDVQSVLVPEEAEVIELIVDDNDDDNSNNNNIMAAELTETGYYLNLTEDQEAKLKEFWVALAKVTGITKDGGPVAKVVSPQEQKPAKRGWFGSKKEETPTETDDKFGLAKEYQKALASHTPEELRVAFWHMAKADHPDSLLLRFLRARKWDVQRALVMLVSAIHWRLSEVHVDDEIMRRGDGGLYEEYEQTKDPQTKKDADEFFKMARNGQSYVRGRDHQGRPICLIRVRLHKIGAHPGRTIERLTVYHIETSRLLLRDKIETACIIFDMTGFTLANMDYAPVKYIIRCFEANYPESLGHILIHNAPWIFSSIWQVIKTWMDPVVVSKVHFTKSLEEVEQFVPRSDIPKSMGGDDDYEYEYIEPVPGENEKMKDTATRDSLLAARLQYASEFQDATMAWIDAAPGEGKDIKEKRHALAEKLRENYWQLDPYVRARSMLDRQGVLQNPYASKPETAAKAPSVSEKTNGEIVTTKPVAEVDAN